MALVDLEALRLTGLSQPSESKRLPRHRPGDKFLKGPIPMDWLMAAANLPGRALHVGISTWFLAGIKKSNRVILTRSLLESLGVSRHAAYRALAHLERAQLIQVNRGRGRNPAVTLLEVPTAPSSTGKAPFT